MKFAHLLLAGLLPAAVLVSCAREEQPAGGGEADTAQQMDMSSDMDMTALTSAADQIENSYVEAYRAGDAAAIAALYTQDGLQLAADGTERSGREAIQAAFATQLGQMGAPDLMLTRETLDGSGDLAYSTGRFEATGQAEGQAEPIHVEGKYLVVLKRGEDGTWKIAAHAWNESAPGQGAPGQMSSDTAAGN